MWGASSLQIFHIKVQQQIRKLTEHFRTNWSFSVAFLLDLGQNFSTTNTNHKTYSTNQLTVVWRGRDLEYRQGEECWLAFVSVPAVQHLGGRDGVLGLGPLSWNLSLLTSGST